MILRFVVPLRDLGLNSMFLPLSSVMPLGSLRLNVYLTGINKCYSVERGVVTC